MTMRTIIAGDIGGTNTRLALFEQGRPVFRWTRPSRNYPEFYPLFKEFLAHCPVASPQQLVVCLAVAGVIEGNRRAKGTNIPWIIDSERIETDTGCQKCIIINDFEAAAWGVTTLQQGQYVQVGGPRPQTGSTMAILGAGTGLGQAIIPGDSTGRYMVIHSEGGHAGFAPESREEIALLSYLMERFGHVSVERVLSGQGLVNIYSFLKKEPADKLEDGPRGDLLAPDITRRAIEESDEVCSRTVELFCRIYGAEAGNLALKCLPYGGVFVAGGIAPVILPFIQKGGFIEAFEAKGCMREVMKKIPVLIVKEPDLGLIGAAVKAAQQQTA